MLSPQLKQDIFSALVQHRIDPLTDCLFSACASFRALNWLHRLQHASLLSSSTETSKGYHRLSSTSEETNGSQALSFSSWGLPKCFGVMLQIPTDDVMFFSLSRSDRFTMVRLFCLLLVLLEWSFLTLSLFSKYFNYFQMHCRSYGIFKCYFRDFSRSAISFFMADTCKCIRNFYSSIFSHFFDSSFFNTDMCFVFQTPRVSFGTSVVQLLLIVSSSLYRLDSWHVQENVQCWVSTKRNVVFTHVC